MKTVNTRKGEVNVPTVLRFKRPNNVQYRTNGHRRTSLKINGSYVGEPLEIKLARMKQNKEPLEGQAELIYTERKDGVQPAYDIRRNAWEIAIEASDKLSKTVAARRDSKPKAEEKKSATAEPLQATDAEASQAE